MSPLPSGPRGLYFDEFQSGQKIITAGRTITESDIVNFAGLSGDFNQIHVDQEYARNSLAGQRVAHGLLVLAIASGLAVQTGIMEGTIVYFREVTEWKFVKPVNIGDTIHVEIEVKETKELRRLGAGTVIMELDVKNQQNETVNRGNWNVFLTSFLIFKGIK
jgi:3-hydroxybutyryl-CoA dehydratase